MAQKTGPEQITTAERRRFVLSLRKMGVSYPQIAEQAIAKFGLESLPAGWDERYAYKDVQREIEKLQAGTERDAEIVRYLWQERLDRMLVAIWPLATGNYQQLPDGTLVGTPPSLHAIDRVLKIGERQAKLAGADRMPELHAEEGAQAILVVVDR